MEMNLIGGHCTRVEHPTCAVSTLSHLGLSENISSESTCTSFTAHQTQAQLPMISFLVVEPHHPPEMTKIETYIKYFMREFGLFTKSFIGSYGVNIAHGFELSCALLHCCSGISLDWTVVSQGWRVNNQWESQCTCIEPSFYRPSDLISSEMLYSRKCLYSPFS